MNALIQKYDRIIKLFFFYNNVNTFYETAAFHLPGWKDPDPLDGPRSHRVPQVLLIQRRVELRSGDVGGDVLRGAAILEPDQQRRGCPVVIKVTGLGCDFSSS